MPTSDTVDTTNLPPFLGINVARVDPNTGKPTKPTLDNELAERDWFLTTTINMNTRLTEVRSDTDTATARITTLETTVANDEIAFAQLNTEVIAARSGQVDLSARFSQLITSYTTADTALSSLVQSVEASISGGAVVSGTASAQIRMAAEANPTGYSASFGVYLYTSTTNFPVGLTLRLTSGGVGQFDVLASQFSITDPSYNGGLPGNVVSYSGGVWTFNIPVQVRTGELSANAATKVRSNSASGTTNVSIVATDWNVGSELTVMAIATSTAGYINSSVTAIPSGATYIQIMLDGSFQNQAYVSINEDTRCTGGTGTVNTTTGVITTFNPTNVVYWELPAAICFAKFNTSSSSHTVTAQWHSGAVGMPNADFFLVVIECKR